MDYNFFEGTIPSDEYGGGTVMVWDRGYYTADEAAEGADEEAVLRREYDAGKMSVTFAGERLHGSYALVRTEAGRSPKWLLIKHRDAEVRRDVDPGDLYTTSVITGRTLDEIAEEDATDGFEGVGFAAMLYRYVTGLPADAGWSFEPAIRGARVHVYVTPDGRQIVPAVPRTSRLYRDVGAGLQEFAHDHDRSFVLDGEMTHDESGAFVLHAYDLLFQNGVVLLEEPWHERRQRLEHLWTDIEVADAVLVPTFDSGGPSLYRMAENDGWAGIVAKRVDSTYRPAERSGDWQKLVFFEREVIA